MTPRRILVAGWLVFLLYAWPGYLTHEAAGNLLYSRFDDFIDWQSPIMMEVWRLVEWVMAGPAGMLILQSLMLLCGTYSLARKQVGDRAGAWIAVAVLLVPPLLATNAVIGLEAQLAAWLVAGFALLQSDRFGRRIGGLAMFVVAVGLRDGGAAAALPIVVSTFVWRTPLAGWRRYAVSLGAWLAVVIVAAGLAYALVDNRTRRDEVRFALGDIEGIRGNEPVAENIFTPDYLEGITPKTPDEQDALFAKRRDLIVEKPGAYLAFRAHVFSQTLGIHRPKWWRTVFTDFIVTDRDAQALYHRGRHSLFQRALVFPVKSLNATPLFWPVCYFALAILLLGVAIWRRRALEIILLASGLTYELSLMFSSFRPNYSDSHPMIVTTLLAAFVLLARYLRLVSSRPQ